MTGAAATRAMPSAGYHVKNPDDNKKSRRLLDTFAVVRRRGARAGGHLHQIQYDADLPEKCAADLQLVAECCAAGAQGKTPADGGPQPGPLPSLVLRQVDGRAAQGGRQTWGAPRKISRVGIAVASETIRPGYRRGDDAGRPGSRWRECGRSATCGEETEAVRAHSHHRGQPNRLGSHRMSPGNGPKQLSSLPSPS